MREKESGWVHGSESSGSYSQPSTMVWWWGMSGFLMLWDSHVLDLEVVLRSFTGYVSLIFIIASSRYTLFLLYSSFKNLQRNM